MTNREIINNISNKDMGVKIFNAITEIQNKYHNHSSFEICDRFIDWLSQEVELTADEMFEQLGYYKASEKEDKVIYSNSRKYRISIIGFIDENTKKREFSFMKSNEEFCCYINKDEDKAIHKKIEEIKNG